MIKATIAAVSFIACCLGNPAGAATYTANDDVIVNRNRNRTYNVDKDVVKNIDRSRTVNRSSSFDYSEITNEAVQHAPIPALPGPAAPDSVPVLSLYTQYSEGAGHTHGAAISIPLSF